MIFVFEDNEEDIISRFFRKAYPENIANKFVYAKGNGNIKRIAQNLLLSTDDEIVVYLDTIPGNKETAKIYKALRDISIKSNYRLIVLPLVCMEYYLIKALKDSQVMLNHTGVDICINKDLYFSSPLIATQEDKAFVKNFEKYCKLILIKNLKECASHSGKTIVDCYGEYYLNDCLCNYKDSVCMPEKLLNKLTSFLTQFDCVPEGSIISNGKKISVNDLWDIHRKLVQLYNHMIEHYIDSANDAVNVSQYAKIKIIK